MDFSKQGAWPAIRFLSQVVPFFNARLQGMYKLGRSGMENPQRMGIVLGATALMSVALMLAYGDDDEWKKREDWDRDNYWWFKFGGTSFRIPKPFEIGAIATLAERGIELFSSPEMTGKRFNKRFWSILGNQLSMNPIPQVVKPIIDVYANQDSFTNRPIETMGMERLEPAYRYTQGSSMAARALSTTGNALTGNNFLSPVQADHLIRGYFGWLGSFVVGSADQVARPLTSEPVRPAPDYWKLATGSMISELPAAQSRYVSEMYDQAKELEQAHGTYRDLLKRGKAQDAAEFLKDNREDLGKYRLVEHVKKSESRINERIRMIANSAMPSDQKKERIARLQAQKDLSARVVSSRGGNNSVQP